MPQLNQPRLFCLFFGKNDSTINFRDYTINVSQNAVAVLLCLHKELQDLIVNS